MQQKRAALQKQAALSRISYGSMDAPGVIGRRHITRQTSYKLAQQQTVLPPFPLITGGALLTSKSGELFPTIEERSPNSERREEEETFSYALTGESKKWQSSEGLTSPVQTETPPLITTETLPPSTTDQWLALPTNLASCQLGDIPTVVEPTLQQVQAASLLGSRQRLGAWQNPQLFRPSSPWNPVSIRYINYIFSKHMGCFCVVDILIPHKLNLQSSF